jgi:hypothetical protein
MRAGRLGVHSYDHIRKNQSNNAKVPPDAKKRPESYAALQRHSANETFFVADSHDESAFQI